MPICSIHKITLPKTNIGNIFTYFSMVTQLQDFNLYTYTLAVYVYRSIQKCQVSSPKQCCCSQLQVFSFSPYRASGEHDLVLHPKL
jgi:hypothetical protein